MSDLGLMLSLSQKFDNVIRDPVWGDIHFDDSLFELAKTTPFRVLDGVRQLGPVAYLYPGATHTRRGHSIGVYYIARRLALSLLERGQIPFASPEGLRAFLIAALCHDLGHYPFAHSLKELPLAAHEALAGDLVLREPLHSAILDSGADPEQVAAIIDSDRSLPDDRETLLFRRILSGVLDPDKIDYLTRDAFYCGIPYGIQDADFILRRILVDEDALSVDVRGEMSVEALLFSKYQMYRSVYWHHSVRSATSMVKKSVLLGLTRGAIVPENLYGLDDAGFQSLVAAGSAPFFKPAKDVFAGRMYSLVGEISYDSENIVHADLNDLGKRLEAETALAMAADIGESDIVIDIPEPIDFETNLMVKTRDGRETFSSRTRLFGPESLKSLVQSLRRIRVFARPGVDTALLHGLARELLA
ncbi:MAG TPA: HD domain-containing protein [Rectinemataceae bacterium]|nr:HD domain-containing protein [Rectinemataceae bacterium]